MSLDDDDRDDAWNGHEDGEAPESRPQTWLHPWFARTVADMAEELGEKPSTVQRRIDVAMQRFRRNWIRMFGERSWLEWRDLVRERMSREG